MLTKRKVRTTILLVFGILILLNIIAAKFFVRLDFTEDKRYSLSSATENLLKNLKDPVTINAYFSEDLPSNIAQVKQDDLIMLGTYGRKGLNSLLIFVVGV